jgi:hypothetical protein
MVEAYSSNFIVDATLIGIVVIALFSCFWSCVKFNFYDQNECSKNLRNVQLKRGIL